MGDCDSSKWPKGPAFGAILSFAQNEDTWLKQFTKAWSIATQNGHPNLVRVAKREKKKEAKR